MECWAYVLIAVAVTVLVLLVIWAILKYSKENMTIMGNINSKHPCFDYPLGFGGYPIVFGDNKLKKCAYKCGERGPFLNFTGLNCGSKRCIAGCVKDSEILQKARQ